MNLQYHYTFEMVHLARLTRTSPIIRIRTMNHIQSGLIDAGVPVFKAQLNEREAFRAMFSFQQTLENLREKDVPNLDKAIANAEQFTVEVVERLRDTKSNASQKETAA